MRETLKNVKETPNIRYALNLRLFDGAAAAGAGDAGGQAGAPQAAETVAPEPKVIYGKDPQGDSQAAPPKETASEPAKPANPEIAREAEFEKLIRGEYAKEFQARTQRMIDERFKVTKSLEERDKAITPVLQAMAGKYGVDPTDTDALVKAIQEDDSYYEEEAIRRGMSVPQLKEVMRLQRENSELMRERQAQLDQRARDEKFRNWAQQAETLKQTYTDFDLRAELANPQSGQQFMRLIDAGVDMRTAYEVMHQSEIQDSAMRAGEQRAVNNIRTRGARPDENGAAAASAPVVRKTDPSKLTNAELAEIEERVRRGERIAF